LQFCGRGSERLEASRTTVTQSRMAVDSSMPKSGIGGRAWSACNTMIDRPPQPGGKCQVNPAPSMPRSIPTTPRLQLAIASASGSTVRTVCRRPKKWRSRTDRVGTSPGRPARLSVIRYCHRGSEKFDLGLIRRQSLPIRLFLHGPNTAVTVEVCCLIGLLRLKARL
jgi:hypothetical protein